MTIPLGVELEKLNFLQDAKDIIDERGNDINIKITSEDNTTRDIYGSIKCKTYTSTLTMHAYPIHYNPTNDQLEEAGIKENVDLILYTAKLDWDNADLAYLDIDTTRWEVILNGETYIISFKNQKNMFSHIYLNYVLGLYKK